MLNTEILILHRFHVSPQAATAADGTHPTGMHSCFNTKFSFLLYCVTEGWLGKDEISPVADPGFLRGRDGTGAQAGGGCERLVGGLRLPRWRPAADPGFPRRRCQPQRESLTYYLVQFLPKNAWK